MQKSLVRRFSRLLAAVTLVVAPASVSAEGQGDRRATFGVADERLSFSASALTGVQGTHTNTMAIGSATFPIASRATGQVELGVGSYREQYFSRVGAGRVFWRTGDNGTIGIYGDYANVDPEHVGRLGLEGVYHVGRFNFEALVGYRFGTNVYTATFNEFDLSYYATDNLKGSIGHRWTSRGHVANVAFEFAPRALSGWTVFGEAEAGDDENHSAFVGMRYTFGNHRHASLMERDRKGPMRIRVPRSIVEVTRCGQLPNKRDATFGLRELSVLCASEDELTDEGAVEEKKSH